VTISANQLKGKMDGQEFTRIVREAFEPFLVKLGFRMELPLISGRYYRVHFNSPKNMVSVSFEPGDEALFVIIFHRENGELSHIDDSSTPRLSDLNSRYMRTVTNDERLKSDTFFNAVHVADEAGKLLLKSAKELSLVLPRYLNEAP
jgi:hypothetical protein